MKGRLIVLYIFCAITAYQIAGASQVRHRNPDQTYKYGIKNDFQSEQPHEFRNLVVDRKSRTLYVGGVNYIFALDADNVQVVKGELRIPPTPTELKRCITFKINPDICQNNIRVLHSVNRTTLYACGTMAYRPTCMYINKTDFKEILPRIKGGEWKDPHDSSTVSTLMGGVLFAATSDHSATSDDIISKSMNDSPLKTQNKDSFWLSEAQFVAAFNAPNRDGQDKVFILFKENAEEIPMEFLTQEKNTLSKLVYSRVATICKNDKGGNTWMLNNKFSTFTKMRIACPSRSVMDRKRFLPFYYDEIRDSFIVPNSKDPSNPTLYAIFTTPSGSVEATATCTYNLRDIENALQSNLYWNRPGTGNSWYTPYNTSFGPPPGECVEDTTTLSNERLSFGKDHPLKYGIIKPTDGHAVYQDTGTTFSYIIVDRLTRIERRGKEGTDKEYDVVHYITESGLIKRVVYPVEFRERHWDIPSREVFDSSEADVILTVKKSDGFLYFGTNTSVVQLSIAPCGDYQSCTECTAHDPYCMWDANQQECVLYGPDIPPVKYYNGHVGTNDSKCQQGGKLTDDSKKSSSSEGHRHSGDAELEAKTNRTIASLIEKNSALENELLGCKHEKASLMKNYTALSTLILRYDRTRKLAIQLYRNTIYSLHKCQHKETLMIQRLRDEENARKEVVVEKNALSKNNSVRMCASEARESEPPSGSVIRTKAAGGKGPKRKCEKQKQLLNIKYTRLAKGFDAKIENLQMQKEKSNQSLSLCTSNAASLESENKLLKRMKSNMTRQNRVLTQQYENSKRTADRLKWLKRRVDCKSAASCELAAGWFLNEHSQTMFFLVNETTTYDMGKRKCTDNGASLATMKNIQERRNFRNFFELFQPLSEFWIGLRKHRNGSLLWEDGTLYDTAGALNFLTGNDKKITDQNMYCMEVESAQNWKLIPCSSHRVSLCEKSFVLTEVEEDHGT